MNVDAARLWIVLASLLVCGFSLAFFLIAPATPYPLDWPQSFRLIEIITPVFLGYLAMATRHAFSPNSRKANSKRISPVLVVLVKGPMFLFALIGVALTIAFGIANSALLKDTRGMSVDMLAAGFAALLGILAITTNVVVEHLFSMPHDHGDQNIASSVNEAEH
jgi:hypothetical protein